MKPEDVIQFGPGVKFVIDQGELPNLPQNRIGKLYKWESRDSYIGYHAFALYFSFSYTCTKWGPLEYVNEVDIFNVIRPYVAQLTL